MYQLRLASVIFVSFIFALVLGCVLYWSSNQVSLYFQRNQTAYDTFAQYEQLSQLANRHFKRVMESFITPAKSSNDDLATSQSELNHALEQLREIVVKNPAISLLTNEEKAEKANELERVARFSAFIESSEYHFKAIEQLRQQGKAELALKTLANYSNEEIDNKFIPLIDTALSIEREKGYRSKQEHDHLITQLSGIAIAASTLAAMFSLITGNLLLRGFRIPIEKLMKGTDEIAASNLQYRIKLHTNDEFSYLASHFNQMAHKLELQQERLRQGRAELETRVQDRTKELHRLNVELTQMDLDRRDFLADISHELRTPITVIRGEAEVTLRGAELLVEDYQDTLQRIVELAMQLGKYVDDLLFLARNETADLQFEWQPIDLVALVAETVEDFRVMAEEKSLTILYIPPPEPLWVRGDKQRLRQLLLILGSNACRYSNPEGKIQVLLASEEQNVSIAIADEGIGIPKKDLQRIFDRHFRSNNARHSSKEGTGLGLAMAKAILNAHAGSIQVSSIEQIGSRFTATLPLLTNTQDKLTYE